MAQVTGIFFDAVGTLFGVKGSVGQIYSQVAQAYGVQANPQHLDQCFYQVFKSAPAAVFPEAKSPDQLVISEWQWWRQIVLQTFAQLGYGLGPEPFPQFEAYFQEVFDLFATEYPWQIYDETLAVLDSLRTRGYVLGIISNFDSRLESVLKVLGLDPFFSSVTLSTQVGAAKPDRPVFQIALAQAQIPAAQALHVGDSFSMDYQGAKQAGLQALWLDRDGDPATPATRSMPEPERITDLRGIFGWLAQGKC